MAKIIDGDAMKEHAREMAREWRRLGLESDARFMVDVIDLMYGEMPDVSAANDASCEGCIVKNEAFSMCMFCRRSETTKDYYKANEEKNNA